MIPKYFIPKCQAEDHVHISWGGYYTTPPPLVTDYDQIMIPKYFIQSVRPRIMFILAVGGGGGEGGAYYTTPQPLVIEYDQIMMPKYFIPKPKCQAEDHVHISWGGGGTTPLPNP